MMTAGEWKRATKLSASDWPDPHTFIVELRDALGMFSGAMPISPKQAWEDALEEVRRLKGGSDPTVPGAGGPIRVPTR